MEKTKAKTLIKQIRGVSYKPDDLHNELDDSSVILLRANNIDDGKINFDDVVYVDKSKVSAEQYLKEGDILICASSGSKNLVGKAASVKFGGECTFGAFCKVVRPIAGFDEYLGAYFQSPVYRRRISEIALGANINNIRNEHIDELDIPVFSIDEQADIVNKIQFLQEIIAKRKIELSKLDDLLKARFVEMFGDVKHNLFGYPIVRIGDVGKLQGGYAFKSKDFVEEGIRLVQIGNVNKDNLDWDVTNYLPEKILKKHKAFSLEVDDLVMAMTRPIIKSLNAVKIAVVGEKDVPSLLNQRVGKFVIDENVLNKTYLMHLCRMNDFKVYVEAMSGNSLQPNISSKQVEDYKILLPPIELQNHFADLVQQVDKSKVAVQKSLDETQILFDSLMQKYFG